MDKLLERAFGNLQLFCCANNLRVQSLRGFTVLNMHASKGAFPFLGCKGADTIVILKWLVFLARLHLADNGWSSQDQQVLTWIRDGAVAGLSFSQGIHGHGIWLKGSCVWFEERCANIWVLLYAFGFPFPRSKLQSVRNGSETSCHDALSD